MSQVQRIEGELFESKKHAERHGLDLCKKWIYRQFTDERIELLEEATRATTKADWHLACSPPLRQSEQ
jgi:hypothetical protein